MSGIDTARRLIEEGARATLEHDQEQPCDVTKGWRGARRRFADIRTSMRSEPENEPLWEQGRRLGLIDSERWLLYLAMAVELHPDTAAQTAIIGEDPRTQLLTPITAARLLTVGIGGPYESHLALALPGSRLERLGLIRRDHPAAGRPTTQQPFRLSEGTTAMLLGAEEPLPPPGLSVRRVDPAQGSAFDGALVEVMNATLEAEGVVALSSRSRRAARQAAIDMASLRETPALIVTPDAEPDDLAYVASLRGGLVVLDTFPFASRQRPIEGMVRRLGRDQEALVVLVPEHAPTGFLPTVEIAKIDFGERARVWELAMGEKGPALADRFAVTIDEARHAVDMARRRARRTPAPRAVMEELRREGGHRMGTLVNRLHSPATLKDLVSTPAVTRQIEDLIATFRTRRQVYDTWGMGADSPLGRGLNCLFTGYAGAGKTFAAQCIANELSLNLYRADLSRIVSRWLGETEKALAEIFDEAEAGHGILLIDEAEALFGKRSEVIRHAQDRYANVEVDFLLQKMEEFEGISILTTNMRDAIDRAFFRRMSFVISFPVPTPELRRKLWARFLPPSEIHREDIDIDVFADLFDLTGGNIRNIGIAAAHMAAASDDGMLSGAQVVRATEYELEKSGLPRSREDFGPLEPLMERASS